MSLKANGRLLHAMPLRHRGGATLSFEYAESNKASQRNIFVGFADQKAGFPLGQAYPSSWLWPMKVGFIASRFDATAVFSGSGSMVSGINASATTAAAFTGTAVGQIVANLTGASTATFSGTGAANIVLNGIASTSATFSGTAALSADGYAAATGSGTFSGTAALGANGYMSGESTPFTELSPEGLASALLDDNDIETNFSLRESIRVLLAVNAGKLSGAAGTTVTIRDVNDTKDRVIATVDANGNRTAVAVDGT